MDEREMYSIGEQRLGTHTQKRKSLRKKEQEKVMFTIKELSGVLFYLSIKIILQKHLFCSWIELNSHLHSFFQPWSPTI